MKDLNDAVNTFSSAGVETFLSDACAVVNRIMFIRFNRYTYRMFIRFLQGQCFYKMV